MNLKKYEKILKFWKKKTGVTRQYTISAGRILVRYRSRIIIDGKLKTEYFPSWIKAQQHYKNELIKKGRIIKRIPKEKLSTIIKRQKAA